MIRTEQFPDLPVRPLDTAPPSALLPTAREPMLAFPSLTLRAAEYLWRPAIGLSSGLPAVRRTQLSGALTCLMAHQALAGGDPLVTVNVDADQLAPELATALVELCGEQAHRLLLEVTETTELHPGWSRAVSILRPGRIGLAVDDAGAGYSDAARIRLLQPQMVKLDRTLLVPLGDGVARALVAAARDVEALVVAEGVESVRDLARAHELGADLVQGYLVNRLEKGSDVCADVVSAVSVAASNG